MSSLQLRQQDGIAHLTLDRPHVHNAFDDALIEELTAALRQLDADSAIRAVVLGGSGSTFSAGADLHWMRAMASAGEAENHADALRLATLMRTLDELGKPTLARVHGPAYGGGVGLIACCDIAIGVPEAKFALSEVKLGLVPAVISPYVVAAIGVRQARRLFLSGEIFDAAEAQRIGLLHTVVPGTALDDALARQLHWLRKGGPRAQAEAKALLRRRSAGNGAHDPEAVDHDNAARIARLRVSPEGREGMQAFLDKRPPRWVDGGAA
jgi:methylglutaconyl-CoA hydratase